MSDLKTTKLDTKDGASTGGKQPRNSVGDWAQLGAMARDLRTPTIMLPASPRAALGVATGSAGGYATPVASLADLVDGVLAASSPMRRLAEVRRVKGDQEYDWPTANPGSGTAGEGEVCEENSGGTEVDPATFGKLILRLRKYGSGKARISHELLEDGGELFYRGLVKLLVGRVARRQNRDFTVGTGSGQASGVVGMAGAGVTAALGYDGLADLVGALAPEWFEDPENPPRFMMSPATFAAVLKLKSTDGVPVFFARRLLFDFPVELNAHMPAATSGNRAVLFGRFDAYKVRDAADVRLAFNRQAAGVVEQDQVLASAYLRSDGGLLVADEGRPPVVALAIS